MALHDIGDTPERTDTALPETLGLLPLRDTV